MIKRVMLLILLIATGALAGQEPPKPLLRDGFVLMGVDGRAVARGDKWFFEMEQDISDGRSIITAGTKIEILPSAGLEKMVADIKDNPGRSYRLYNAMVTVYRGENYLFCDYFLPLVRTDTAPAEKPAVTGTPGREPNEPMTEVMINEPNDAVMIPQEIIDKLRTRRVIRPQMLKQGLELKQDSILADRTGYIKQKPDGGWVFEFDALGRNTSSVSLELLPCRALAMARARQGKMPGELRFKVSGIVTKYQDRYYLLLQTANRAYGHGNFGG